MSTPTRWLFLGAAAIAALAGPQLASASAQSGDGYQQHCRDVEVTRRKHHNDKNRVAGTAIGAVAGGVVGNQFGKGKGKTATTIAGAVGGGIVGNKIQKSHQRDDTETVIERRCD